MVREIWGARVAGEQVTCTTPERVTSSSLPPLVENEVHSHRRLPENKAHAYTHIDRQMHTQARSAYLVHPSRPVDRLAEGTTFDRTERAIGLLRASRQLRPVFQAQRLRADLFPRLALPNELVLVLSARPAQPFVLRNLYDVVTPLMDGNIAPVAE
jgi:hypothetical protein